MKFLRSRRTPLIQISPLHVITILPGSVEVNGTCRLAELIIITCSPQGIGG
jgi:hypothetical protein